MKCTFTEHVLLWIIGALIILLGGALNNILTCILACFGTLVIGMALGCEVAIEEEGAE